MNMLKRTTLTIFLISLMSALFFSCTTKPTTPPSPPAPAIVLPYGQWTRVIAGGDETITISADKTLTLYRDYKDDNPRSTYLSLNNRITISDKGVIQFAGAVAATEIRVPAKKTTYSSQIPTVTDTTITMFSTLHTTVNGDDLKITKISHSGTTHNYSYYKRVK